MNQGQYAWCGVFKTSLNSVTVTVKKSTDSKHGRNATYPWLDFPRHKRTLSSSLEGISHCIRTSHCICTICILSFTITIMSHCDRGRGCWCQHQKQCELEAGVQDNSGSLVYRSHSSQESTLTIVTASSSLMTSQSPSEAITMKLSDGVARYLPISGSHSTNLHTGPLKSRSEVSNSDCFYWQHILSAKMFTILRHTEHDGQDSCAWRFAWNQFSSVYIRF